MESTKYNGFLNIWKNLSSKHKVLDYLEFYINTDYKKVSNIKPQLTVLEYLRENAYFGTKYGCGEGNCGACTVVIAELDHNSNKVKYRSANACLLPLCSINNKQIITVEGIGNPKNPHPIQVNIFNIIIIRSLFHSRDLINN
jgi:xanthine dehydrogenase/oxidase